MNKLVRWAGRLPINHSGSHFCFRSCINRRSFRIMPPVPSPRILVLRFGYLRGTGQFRYDRHHGDVRVSFHRVIDAVSTEHVLLEEIGSPGLDHKGVTAGLGTFCRSDLDRCSAQPLVGQLSSGNARLLFHHQL